MAYIPPSTRARVREQSGDLCGYCHAPQRIVWGTLELDHLVPSSRGGSNAEVNLWTACSICNSFKSDHESVVDPETGQITPIFNPRIDSWNDHFRWDFDGARILGRTPTGRGTIQALQMNADHHVQLRELWVSVGWFPPEQDLRQSEPNV